MKRLMQMGEDKERIYNVGAPNVDIILRKDRPTLKELKLRYNYIFDEYGIILFHSVVTELNHQRKQVNCLINAIKKTNYNYVVIFPNNDQGSSIIKNAFKKRLTGKKFRLIPSMRFEYYLTLLENSKFILGNSSSGIMEAPYFGIPTINVGTRQNRRAVLPSIKNTSFNERSIIRAIYAYSNKKFDKIQFFGKNNSSNEILKILSSSKFWKFSSQKYFRDL